MLVAFTFPAHAVFFTCLLLALADIKTPKRTRNVKMRKLVCWNKNCLLGRTTVMLESNAKKGNHSMLLTDKQVPGNLQESRASSDVMVTWEDKCYYSEHLHRLETTYKII